MAAILCSLNRDQRQALADYDIEPMELDNRGTTMYVIAEANINIALQVLNMTLGETQQSQHEGIHHAQLIAAPTTGGETQRRVPSPGRNAGETVVTIRGHNLGDTRSMDKLSELVKTSFLPKLRRKVVIHTIGGERSDLINNGDFHIHIFASPQGDRRYKPPKEMFGIAVSNRKKSYRPSGRGKGIICSDSDWVAAELVGENNLYIHHNMMDATSADAQILEQILEKVLQEMPEIVDTRPTGTDANVTVYDEAREAARQAYVQACAARVDSDVLALQSEIESTRQRVEKLRAELASAQQNAYLTEAKLQAFRQGNSGAIERLKREYDTMIEHPLITDVRVESGEIKVYTAKINCTDPRSDVLHEIGEFRITLSTDGKGKVRWKNLTRQVNGGAENMQAPHVENSGKACMGNTQESFANLLANSEYAQAAFLAIEFVQSVNVGDSWGQYITRWPEASSSD